jgi:hypothetical protein
MTIKELLDTMQNKYKGGDSKNIRSLSNNKETWQRIANKDDFSDLGFTSDSEKESFLKEWCKENDYSNI